ncbi:MAG: hypothetical protein ACJ8C4_15930 [Gemmataceae bacterium]
MANLLDEPVARQTDVQHPLTRLGGAIRRYVAIEGAAAVGMFLALWFWLGLAADFGSFKLFNWDWVQEWPRSFRGVLLVGLSVGLLGVVIFKLVRRLTVDFAPAGLALVLEKKFPARLGDRLITAVELADLDRAESQGYSRAMIEETMREASSRVGEVPFHDVFDWSRLKRLKWWAIALAVGPFLIFGSAYSAIKRTNPAHDFLPRFREVTVTWIKRDLLLRDVIWPRRAMLELLDFPESGELKVGRDSAAPRLRIRARRWVWADASVPEGWRQMTWADLSPEFLGSAIPALPSEFMGKDTSLDRLEMALDDPTTRQRLGATGESLVDLFAKLTTKAQQPGTHPTFRRLEVPDRVEVKYWGAQTSNRMELARGPGWEYTGAMSDLKESVKFWVRGVDYYTATRLVTLVPPPALQELKRIEFRPAYLYHRPPIGSPPEGGPMALRGLRQRVTDLASLNGPTTRFSLPAGTELVLEATVDKELTEAVLHPRGHAGESSVATTTLDLAADRLGFHHNFGPVVTPLDFEFEFTDTDGVRASRHVTVELFRDLPPVVNVVIDGIRKTPQGHYLVTPSAQIPFDGKVADGVGGQPGGLDRVDYTLTLMKLQSSGDVNVQASWLAETIAPAFGGPIANLAVQTWATTEVSKQVVAASPESMVKSFPLETFQQAMRDRAGRDVTRAELVTRLSQEPGANPLIKEFVLQPRFESFDLRARMPELKVKEELAVQPRYRMKLTVTATDNNVETAPGIAANKEPPFTVMIVSEPELLVEVAREEENLHLKTEDAIARLREARQKLEKTSEELTAAPKDQLATLGQRAQEVLDGTEKARDVVQEVFNDYSRVLRELELNRVSPKLIAKVRGEICMPLEGALKVEFVSTTEAIDAFRRELEAARKPTADMTQDAKARLTKLIDKLVEVMNAMGEVTTINKLIATLREIEKGQDQTIGPRLKELQRLQREKLRKQLEGEGEGK